MPISRLIAKPQIILFQSTYSRFLSSSWPNGTQIQASHCISQDSSFMDCLFLRSLYLFPPPPFHWVTALQEAIMDGTEIAVSRSLHSELMCPICLDMLKNTMTTKECSPLALPHCITALRMAQEGRGLRGQGERAGPPSPSD